MSYPDDKETFRRVVNQDLTEGIPGDTVDENDQNLPADFLERLQDTLGYGIKMGYATVKAFFDWIASQINTLVSQMTGKADLSGATFTGLTTHSAGIKSWEFYTDNPPQYKFHDGNMISFQTKSGVYSSELEMICDDPAARWMININSHTQKIKFDFYNGSWATLWTLDMTAGTLTFENEIQMTNDDIKFLDTNKGVILKDRTTATLYRLKVDNGVLGIESI